jgi:triacylglycerol lipase
MAGKVASLTTISTPHGGSKTLNNILAWPDFLLRGASAAVNLARRLADDKNPDFYAGIRSMGSEYMREFNEANPDMPGVYYQSFAGQVYAPASDLILSWPGYVVKDTEGMPNDGLVTVESAQWANFRGVIRGAGYRGISHADEVDLRREDIEIEPLLGAATVCGLYAAMVAELGQMGY